MVAASGLNRLLSDRARALLSMLLDGDRMLAAHFERTCSTVLFAVASSDIQKLRPKLRFQLCVSNVNRDSCEWPCYVLCVFELF